MYDIDKYWAYFLGFFWGDGSVRSGVVIGIVHKDGLFLEEIFAQCMPFCKTIYNPKNKQQQAYYRFKNKEFLKFLMENDFWDKSVLSPSKILKIIPNELHRYFWLGYVDADGCFSKKKVGAGGRFSFSGSFSQDWLDFSNLIKSLQIESAFYFQKDYGKGASSVFEIKYGPDLTRLGEYLYPNGFELGLRRKYEKYIMIKDSLPKLTSQWKGVGFHKGEGRWRAYGPKNKYLGWFDTEDQARQARLKFLARTDASKTPET